MGTDIHIYVEGFNGERWEEVPKPFYDEELDWWRWSDEYLRWQPGGDEDYQPQVPDPENRSYLTFAFLANVRNGRGFAGIKTHEPITPQFPRRGIPEDTSMSDKEWIGDHSFTYATLDELRAAPWEETGIESEGVIHATQYRQFVEKGRPVGMYAGNVSGRGTKVWETEADFLEAIDRGEISPEVLEVETGEFLAGQSGRETSHYVRVRWYDYPLADRSFKRWLDCDWMNEVERKYGGAQNVRVLMGFDS